MTQELRTIRVDDEPAPPPRNGKRVLVVGYGSAGRRHARLLREIGCDVSVSEAREEQREQARKDGYEVLLTGIDLTSIRQFYWGALLAVGPTTDSQLRRVPWWDLFKDMPIFIEKPGIWAQEEYGSAQIQSHVTQHPYRVAVGFQLRAIPGLIRFPRKVLYAFIYDHQNMSTWPEASYRRNFLTEFTHEIDLANWLYGPIEAVKADWRGTNEAVIQLACSSGALVTVSLSGRHNGYQRGIVAHDDTRYAATLGGTVHSWDFTHEQNAAAYRAQLEAWLHGTPYCTIKGALETWALTRTILQSTGRSSWERVVAREDW